MPEWMILCPELGLREITRARTFADAMPFASEFADRHKLHAVPGTGILKGPGYEEYLWEVELPLPAVPSLLSTYREYWKQRSNDENGTLILFRAYPTRWDALSAALSEWWYAIRAKWDDPARGWIKLIMITDFWRYPGKGYPDEPDED